MGHRGGDIGGQVEFALGLRHAVGSGDDGVARAVYLDGVHGGDDEGERINGSAGAKGIVARVGVGIKSDAEAQLDPAGRLGTDGELVDEGPL